MMEHRLDNVTVLMDAMNTVFEPLYRRDVQLEMVYNWILAWYDRPLRVSNPQRLWKLFGHFRAQREPTSARWYAADWASVHQRVIAEYFALPTSMVPLGMGQKIHHAMLGDLALYHVRADMRHFIEALADRRVRLFLVTNQHTASVTNFVRHFGLGRLFTDIIDSEFLQLLKRDAAFWPFVIQQHLRLDPARVVVIGNSLKNDGPARKTGARVLLFSRNGRGASAASLPSGVVCVRTPKQMLRWIVAHHHVVS